MLRTALLAAALAAALAGCGKKPDSLDPPPGAPDVFPRQYPPPQLDPPPAGPEPAEPEIPPA